MNVREPAVEVRDVAAGYGRGCVLDAITFRAARGEILALFGREGSGKTTLLRILGNSLKPESGTVRILGARPGDVRKLVGVVQESPRQNSLLTPNQSLAASLLRHGVPASQRPARVAEALELAGLYAIRDRPIRELSGSQRIGLALARATAHRPAVLLLDNVTASLSEPLREAIWDRLRDRCRADGLAVVHATTCSSEAQAADRVLLFDGGRMLACAPPRDLLDDLGRDTVMVEALDPASVRRTLRGIFDVQIEETPDGVRFSAEDGLSAAAQLLRHPTESVRTIHVRKPTLWDLIENLRK